MTPTDLLTRLKSLSPPTPLKISEFETIVSWETWLESTEYTLTQITENKRSYHTALRTLEKVAGVLNVEEDETNPR